MSLRAAFDTNGGDWAALFAQSTDQANQLRFTTAGLEAAANISNYARVASTGSVGDGLYPRYNSDRAKYGKGYVTWAPSATVGQQMYIGTNLGGGTHNSHSVAAGNVISGGMWVLRSSGSAADTWRLRLYNIAAGTVIASSAAVALSSSAFTRFTVTGTAAGATSQYALILERVSGSDTTTLLLTGAMLVNGPTVPDWYNSGPTSLLGVLTDYWGGGKWGLGFVKPYQYVAPVGKAELKLNNHDKRFSPEYASGPLYGMLLPNLLVQIGDPDHGIWWTGWTDSWAPEPGEYRDKFAVLRATDARRFLDKPLALLPLQESTAANTLIDNFMLASLVKLPNTTSGIPAASGVTVAWDAAATETVPYYGDGNGETDPVSKIVADVVGGVQGKFWMNRQGQYQFTAGQGDDTPASYVDIAQDWINIGNIEAGAIINSSNAKIYIRKTAAGVTLWELDAAYSLAVGAEEVERVFFRDTDEQTQVTGARQSTVGISSGTTGGSIAVVITSLGAQSAVVSAENFAGGTGTVDSITVTGTAVIAKKTIEKNYQDSASVTANGLQRETLDFNWTQSRTWAKRLVRYRVNRFKDVRNELPWVEYDVNENAANAFNCWVGAAVHVTDNQTGHDDYYAVIGELHTVRDGLTNHTVKLYLEPLYPTTVASTSI